MGRRPGPARGVRSDRAARRANEIAGAAGWWRRQAWINLDFIWVGAPAVAGCFALGFGVWSFLTRQPMGSDRDAYGEDTVVMFSDRSGIVARERSADLVRAAERQRRLTPPRQSLGRQLSFVDRGRSRWSQGVRHLRALGGERPATLAPCPE